MYAKGLQLIRLSGDRVVLKRGMQELLLGGPGVASIVEPLLKMLDETATREQIVGAFSANLQPEVDQLLTSLLQRRLITEQPETAPGEEAGDPLQAAYYQSFGAMGARAPARLREARILVAGANLVSRSLVRSLLEMEVGEVRVVRHPVLDNHLVPFSEEALGSRGAGALRLLDSMPSGSELEDVALLCAASDFGPFDALLEVNRIALRLKKPFLPLWLADMVGRVGPLNHAFETACFRCYQVRAESNDAAWDVARAIREHTAADPAARSGVGLLPPMAGIVGEIGAMEIVKHLGGFAPGDVVGRLIEINLTSFNSAVRRVLKIPRCPECSEVMQHGPMALTLGPQIPSE